MNFGKKSFSIKNSGIKNFGMKTPGKEMFQILSLRKMHFQRSVKTSVKTAECRVINRVASCIFLDLVLNFFLVHSSFNSIKYFSSAPLNIFYTFNSSIHSIHVPINYDLLAMNPHIFFIFTVAVAHFLNCFQRKSVFGKF